MEQGAHLVIKAYKATNHSHASGNTGREDTKMNFQGLFIFEQGYFWPARQVSFHESCGILPGLLFGPGEELI